MQYSSSHFDIRNEGNGTNAVNIPELPAVFDENIEKNSLEYHESMHIYSMCPSSVFVIMNVMHVSAPNLFFI